MDINFPPSQEGFEWGCWILDAFFFEVRIIRFTLPWAFGSFLVGTHTTRGRAENEELLELPFGRGQAKCAAAVRKESRQRRGLVCLARSSFVNIRYLFLTSADPSSPPLLPATLSLHGPYPLCSFTSTYITTATWSSMYLSMLPRKHAAIMLTPPKAMLTRYTHR